MIGNYWNSAYRNLMKRKGFSFINVFGLAVGMEVVAYSEKVLLRFISMAEKLPIPRNCSISLLRR